MNKSLSETDKCLNLSVHHMYILALRYDIVSCLSGTEERDFHSILIYIFIEMNAVRSLLGSPFEMAIYEFEEEL